MYPFLAGKTHISEPRAKTGNNGIIKMCFSKKALPEAK